MPRSSDLADALVIGVITMSVDTRDRQRMWDVIENTPREISKAILTIGIPDTDPHLRNSKSKDRVNFIFLALEEEIKQLTNEGNLESDWGKRVQELHAKFLETVRAALQKHGGSKWSAVPMNSVKSNASFDIVQQINNFRGVWGKHLPPRFHPSAETVTANNVATNGEIEEETTPPVVSDTTITDDVQQLCVEVKHLRVEVKNGVQEILSHHPKPEYKHTSVMKKEVNEVISVDDSDDEDLKAKDLGLKAKVKAEVKIEKEIIDLISPEQRDEDSTTEEKKLEATALFNDASDSDRTKSFDIEDLPLAEKEKDDDDATTNSLGKSEDLLDEDDDDDHAEENDEKAVEEAVANQKAA